MKTCIRCGGSWAGAVAFDPMCRHDLDEPPEPDVVFACWLDRRIGYERGFEAKGLGLEAQHPTREGAIAAWKHEWWKQRAAQRIDEACTKALESVGYFRTQDDLVAAMDRDIERSIVGTAISDSKPDDEFVAVQIGDPFPFGAPADLSPLRSCIRASIAKKAALAYAERFGIPTPYAVSVPPMEALAEKVHNELRRRREEKTTEPFPVGTRVRVIGGPSSEVGRIGYVCRHVGPYHHVELAPDEDVVALSRHELELAAEEPKRFVPGAHVFVFDAGRTEGDSWREARVIEFRESMGRYLVALPNHTKMWALPESVRPAPVRTLEDIEV